MHILFYPIPEFLQTELNVKHLSFFELLLILLLPVKTKLTEKIINFHFLRKGLLTNL